MKVIIPMSGMGKRFVRAGFQDPKPLIKVEGRPIIEHIIRRFSPQDSFVFGINDEHDKTTPIRSILNNIAPQASVISMPYQKGGPVDSVRQMVSAIEDEEPAVINYCDFSWVWDYEHFKRVVRENGCDGAVVCYKGFHPHLLGPNQYATLSADGLWMNEIREKYSWNEDKTKNWTSSGTYYFKKGKYIKKYFDAITARPELKMNDEYYVSQVFQLMKEDGLKIFIYQIPYMLQWGTPEDLEEYLYWSKYFHWRSSFKQDSETYPMNGLILMAGAGKRFADEGYELPKPYLHVDGGMMVEKSAASLPRAEKYTFVTREELRRPKEEMKLEEIFFPLELVSLEGLSEGQACTALYGMKNFDLEKPLLIGACDHRLVYDSQKFKKMISDARIDALIFTYRNNPAVRRNPEAYGWVDADDDGRVKRISVKVPLPGDPMTNHVVTGSFWFRKGRFFTGSAEQMILEDSRIKNEFYIDQTMNYLIRGGLNVFVFEVDYYISWGTPDDLRTYEYWQRYFMGSK